MLLLNLITIRGDVDGQRTLDKGRRMPAHTKHGGRITGLHMQLKAWYQAKEFALFQKTIMLCGERDIWFNRK